MKTALSKGRNPQHQPYRVGGRELVLNLHDSYKTMDDS